MLDRTCNSQYQCRQKKIQQTTNVANCKCIMYVYVFMLCNIIIIRDTEIYS